MKIQDKKELISGNIGQKEFWTNTSRIIHKLENVTQIECKKISGRMESLSIIWMTKLHFFLSGTGGVQSRASELEGNNHLNPGHWPCEFHYYDYHIWSYKYIYKII